MDNDASSLRVLDTGCPKDQFDVSGCEVTLYEHPHYGGWSATLNEGEYKNDAMRMYGVRND